MRALLLVLPSVGWVLQCDHVLVTCGDEIIHALRLLVHRPQVFHDIALLSANLTKKTGICANTIVP